MRFNSSQLVQCLAGLGVAGPAARGPAPTVADRLSSWLGWTDAIALFDALQGGPATGTAPSEPGAAARGREVADALERTRTELTRSITTDDAFVDDAADAATRRSHHLAQQRTMEKRLALLRANVRAALSAHSPDLARLATLDALLERALVVRERHLLSSVPGLLAQQAADGQARTAALLAELALRLEPIQGMVEALSDAARRGRP